MTSESEQEEWLARATAGDASARTHLLELYRDRLKKMVAMRLPARIMKRLDASDIVQETMIQANHRLDEYLRAKPLPFYPWLRQLAWEQLVSSYRKHYAKRRTVFREQDFASEISDESVIELAKWLSDHSDDPLHKLLRIEKQTRLQDALNLLPNADREILVLRYLEQLSTIETAAVLKLSVSAAKMRHLRAIQRLREIMNTEFSDLENE